MFNEGAEIMRKKLSCVIVLSLVGLLLSGCGIDADYLNELGFAISDDGKLVSENTDDADGSAEENNSQNVSEKNSESDPDGKSEKNSNRNSGEEQADADTSEQDSVVVEREDIDYEEAYADVIHEYSGYREMLGHCGPGSKSLYIGYISSWSEIINFKPESLGYCFCDIDGDGICEMFIMDGDDVMYAMYALINGSPENVFYGNSVNKYEIERTGENACLIRNYVDKDSNGKRYNKVYRYSQGELTIQYSFLEEQNVIYYDDGNLTDTWVDNAGGVHFYLLDNFRNADWDKLTRDEELLPDVILADAAGLKVTSIESEQAQIDDTFKDAEVISLPQRTGF